MKLQLRYAALALAVLSLAAPLRSQESAHPSRDWSKEFQEVLQQNILKFWVDHAIDRQHGGMLGWLDRKGNPIKPGTKSLVQQSRIVWSFSAAYQMFPDRAYKEVAAHTLKFMREKMWDTEQGGFYWLVDREGNVRDGKKHLYGQSFAIYGLAEYARAFDDSKYGDFSKQPYLDVTIPSIADPSLAPPGKHVMSIYMQFAPFKLKTGDWDSRAEALGDTVVNTLAQYAPNLKGLILKGQVITPKDLETTYSLTSGHIFHGELALDQIFTMRPLLDWARYRTPITGLYLCGSGTHPGTGLTGGSGANAAREILKDLR